MYVGTGDSSLIALFYEKCGLVESHIIKDFFIDNYDDPIYECGKQLTDMVYLKKNFKYPNYLKGNKIFYEESDDLFVEYYQITKKFYKLGNTIYELK